MNQGAKLLLGVLAIGGIGALIFASEKKANASPGGGPPVQPPVLPPSPGLPVIPPLGGTVIVPPLPPLPPLPGVPEPGPSAPAPQVAPPPAVIPGIVPGPGGTTVTLPGIGTFNPATGNVFGPNGVIIGTFNPTTGQFTPSGSAAPAQVLPPLPPVPTQVLPGLTITPGPSPTPAEPPASPAEQASSIAPDTLTVLTSMLSQEHSPRWRVIPEPTLIPWQQARGLKGDGDFGTGTALRMAQEVGTIPIIRGWPKGTVKTGPQLPAYRKALLALAATAPEPRKSQLIAAAAREQGQGYGTPEVPIATLITLQDG